MISMILEHITLNKLLIGFTLGWWIWNSLHVKFTLFCRGTLKYKILNALSKLVYLKPWDVETLLKMDEPTDDIYERRKKGREALEKRLVCADEDNVSPALVDCRFQKVKVIMPLFKNLEVTNPNKVIKHEGSKVTLPSGKEMYYLSSDAIHFMGQGFYRSLQKQIADKISTNTTLQCPITINPDLEQNVDALLKMMPSYMDGVRYHTSGSEAVDSAIRDVRKSTGKEYIVRFKNAYHGHTMGVVNEAPNQIYLDEMDTRSLDFIEEYHYLIGGVIVNPMQFLNPNKLSPPGEKVTYKGRRDSGVSEDQYARWLHDLGQKCQYCTRFLTPVAFMMDDIYFAFRTPELFSYKHFSRPERPIEPDLVILGKGLASGFPLSAVLGRKRFMNHYDKNYLLKVNRIVGTFSAYQHGILASNVFLQNIVLPETIEDMKKAIIRFDAFTANTNQALEEAGLPVRLKNFSNTFNFLYLEDSIYNSFFPQYLMAEDIFLSYQSTGKFNFNADWTSSDFAELTKKIVNAATTMKADGFFIPGKLPWKRLLRQVALENLSIRYKQIMHDKHVDITVSHNHPVNKWTHFWSSVFMILFFYPFAFMGYPITAVLNLLATQVLRQIGHFFYEKQDKDVEKLKFGHKDGSKKSATVGVAACFALYYYRDVWMQYLSVKDFVKAACIMAFLPHFLEICHQYGTIRGFDWVLKIWTDPLTDVPDFYEAAFINPKHFLDTNFEFRRNLAKAKSV